jgi:hypothetical protein
VLDESDIPFVRLGCNAEGNDERDMSGGGFRTLWGFGKIDVSRRWTVILEDIYTRVCDNAGTINLVRETLYQKYQVGIYLTTLCSISGLAGFFGVRREHRLTQSLSSYPC